MSETGLVNVGIPTELADQITWLQSFERLGIRGRNAFVTEAVREHVARLSHQLLEMAELEKIKKEEPDLLGPSGSWPRAATKTPKSS